MRLCHLVPLLLVLSVGCASVAPPRLMHPGPAYNQQRRAEIFDPYPETDVGPNVLGGRPTGYDLSAPENERAQNSLSHLERYRQAPPAGRYGQPSTNPARQNIIYAPAFGNQPALPMYGP